MNTLVAREICSLLFPAGSWTTSSAASVASFRVTRDGKSIEHGTVRIRHGQLEVTTHRLRRGRYEVTLTLGQGRHQTVVARRYFSVR